MRAKKLYCPDCQTKLSPVYQKEDNYQSLPGIRYCVVCDHLLKTEDCWVSNYSKLGYDLDSIANFFENIMVSETTFRIRPDMSVGTITRMLLQKC